jgi:PTS system nitrogen regulatory IIA component
MDLKIKDIIDLLQVSEKTVYRWIKEKKIPCYRINHQYRFSRSEINEWILSNKIEHAPPLVPLAPAAGPDSFTRLLERGGVHAGIAGGNVAEILRHAVDAIPAPADTSKAEILAALLSREELMPTAIGQGIGIPHPRNPIITDAANASVAICYLRSPADFQALDGRPVETLFLLLTASPRMHLDVLAKISFLCRQDAFLALLARRAARDELLDFVRAQETAWQQQKSPAA